MQTSIATQIEYYKSGEAIPVEAILVLWDEHCHFHGQIQEYEDAIKEAKAFMNKTPRVITDTFIILETNKVPEFLSPIVVRMLNLIHKGKKIISTVVGPLYIPTDNELSKQDIHSLLQSEYLFYKEKQFTIAQKFVYMLRLVWLVMTGNTPYEDPTSRMYRHLVSKTV